VRIVQPEVGFTADDVKAVLATRSFVFVDCYTITAPNGDKIWCGSGQEDVIVTPIGGGVKVTFTSKGMKIDGIKMKQGIGVEVDEQDAVIDFDNSIVFQSLPLSTALLWGRFDGGNITRDRYFAASWGGGNAPTVWMGGTRMFSGRIGELSEVGRSYCKLKVRSNLMLLDKDMPSILFQPGCKNAIYDAGCTLDRSLFKVDGIVGAGSTDSVINWTGALANMGLGTVYIVVGGGVTLIRTIRDVVVGSQLILSNPLEQFPMIGATFSTYQGCDRSFTRCGVLGNQVNFRGYPFVPTEETAL
jgi:uncharacterized phage protein (TIGR02218 family)